MPRPSYSGSNSIGNKTGNFFTRWKEKREEKKQDALNEAARMITNETAENESKIVDTLRGIDFLHSKLPKEVREKKSNPQQSCGDLEYATEAICRQLQKHQQTIKMDIREIDKRLLALAYLLDEAVVQGDIQAAYAAKAGLLRGVNEIRNQIPQNAPELARPFVEQNTTYLDGWLTLVATAKEVDMRERNLEPMRKRYEEKALKVREEEEKFKKMTQDKSSPEALALYQIMNNDTPAARTKWTPEQRKMHRRLVDHALEKVQLKLQAAQLDMSELMLGKTKYELEVLFDSLDPVPVVTDPNLVNKQKELVDQLMMGLSIMDTEINENFKYMEELEGRVEQLNNAPGTHRAKEIATETAERLVADVVKEQQAQAGGMEKELADYRKKIGILTEEEQNERIAASKREQQEQVEAAYAEATEEREQEALHEDD